LLADVKNKILSLTKNKIIRKNIIFSKVDLTSRDCDVEKNEQFQLSVC